MSDLIERLKKHDYFYQYSDDNGAFIAGMGEEGRLITALAELPVGPQAFELLFKYVPEGMREDWAGRIAKRAAIAGVL